MKILLSLLMAIMFLGGQAAANEGNICDGEVGAAKGLCIAYCLSLDCESANPSASAEACASVLANYILINEDYPPCSNPCPLWSEDELISTYARHCCPDMRDDFKEGTSQYIKFYDRCESEVYYALLQVTTYMTHVPVPGTPTGFKGS